MRAVPLVALLLSMASLAFSGCSSPSPDAAQSAPSPTATYTVQGDNGIAAPAFTDTLHLLAEPKVTTRAPDAYTDLRLPIAGTADIASGASTGKAVGEWRLTLGEGLHGVVGRATFWVDVEGTVVNNPNPLVDHCFWEFRFLTGDVNTGASVFAPCVKENATVAEGVRPIVFAFDLGGVDVPAGQDLRFQLYTQDFGRAPGATVDLLTGSIVHDSLVQLAGLHLPLDPPSLLATV